MALGARSRKMRTLLKDQIRKKGLTYGLIAAEVGVSLPTVKRWMTKDDFPFEALDTLLRLLDLKWAELMEKVDEPVVDRARLSEKQEAFITNNPQAGYVFLQLFRGVSFDEISANLKIKRQELERICLLLDKQNLVAYEGPQRIRPLVRGPFKLKGMGIFSKRFYQQCAHVIHRKVFERNAGFNSDIPGQDSWIALGEMYMSRKSFAEMKLDFWKLREHYREVAQRDLLFLPPSDVFPVTQMYFLMEMDLWRNVMWDSREG